MTSTTVVARIVSRFRRHLTYANVAATLALVLASSGTAYAVNTVRSPDIVDGAVKSVDIATNGVQSIDIKNGGVALADLTPAATTALSAGAVDAIDDLEGLPCTVGANPGTVTITPTGGGPGVEDIGLQCVQTPLECTSPQPTNVHASFACNTVTGDWGIVECDVGFINLNGNADDGCEYEFSGGSPEVCNGADDDGDGQVDESTGYYVPYGQVLCTSGFLQLSCENGYIPDGDIDDGCVAAP